MCWKASEKRGLGVSPSIDAQLQPTRREHSGPKPFAARYVETFDRMHRRLMQRRAAIVAGRGVELSHLEAATLMLQWAQTQ